MTDIRSRKEKNIYPLIEGYKKFREKFFQDTSFFNELVEYGQKPKVLIIACCDSRVDPAIVTNCNPGEIFVVRNVANLVPPFDNDMHHHGTSAALEYAVRCLEVKDIIVFGHSHCGGIQALMEQSNNSDFDFIGPWMDIAKEAKQKVREQCSNCSFEEQSRHCEKESLLVSLNNLQTFPWIREKVLADELSLHAWYLNLDDGTIETYDNSNSNFILL